MPTAAVGRDAPAAEEDEEPLERLLAEADEPEAPEPEEEDAAASEEVPAEACETTELLADWMLARMEDWPALTLSLIHI